ncbi:hypothetical protein CAEBREN_28904 [Caenorhabditis brenneri]|uniref:Uncharacterized protein n=1 Tax=Caenorhabditis brenneri TaxID=135651 RepID=G0PKB6_CAEBE|nr:hypothetical protein CAEBREN_28904 [Caenorhabditis brenneri]
MLLVNEFYNKFVIARTSIQFQVSIGNHLYHWLLRKKSNASKHNGFSASRIFASTISNASSSRPSRPSTFDESLAHRKRSTSLPDGEKLNLDFLETANNNSVPAIPANVEGLEPPSFRRASIVDGYSSHSESPSQSQYPSYRDLTTAPHQRKRGIATVFPIRKRSLSCGDAVPVKQNENGTSGAITTAVSPRPTSRTLDGTVNMKTLANRASSPDEIIFQIPIQPLIVFQEDDEHALIDNDSFLTSNGNSKSEDGLRSCPQPRRKNKHSFLRDPSPLAKRIRDASPFGKKKPFWNSNKRFSRKYIIRKSSPCFFSSAEHTSSPADSISRLFRRIRGGNSGNDYADLNHYCDDEEDLGDGVYEMQEMNELSRNGNLKNGRERMNGARTNRSMSCSPVDECGTLTDNSEPLLAIPSSSVGDSSISTSLSCS